MASELSKEEREKKLIEKFDALNTKEKEKWQREIELLETRVQTNFKDIAIDDKGGTIAIKASLSDSDMGEITKLDQKRSKLGTKNEDDDTLTLTEKEIDTANEIAWEILGMVTANPVMTKEWFASNRDKYSTEDMMTVSLGYYEGMKGRMERVSKIQQFRNKPTRH